MDDVMDISAIKIDWPADDPNGVCSASMLTTDGRSWSVDIRALDLMSSDDPCLLIVKRLIPVGFDDALPELARFIEPFRVTEGPD